VIRNKNLIVLAIISGQAQGVQSALVTVIGDISIRDHYPLSAAYMFGSLFIAGGIIGAIVIGN
tara:strand:- start:15 stop:203 length:189 start_codon:yes stop_codon:yes gene_type:complete